MKKNEIIIQISIVILVLTTGTGIYFFSSIFYKDIPASFENKDERLIAEQIHPQQFLLDKSSIKHTVKDKKVVLEGCVFSQAKNVSYKNIVLNIDFYNERSIRLKKQKLVITKSIFPNQTIDYKTVLDGFEDVKYAIVTILKAEIKEKISY